MQLVGRLILVHVVTGGKYRPRFTWNSEILGLLAYSMIRQANNCKLAKLISAKNFWDLNKGTCDLIYILVNIIYLIFEFLTN